MNCDPPGRLGTFSGAGSDHAGIGWQSPVVVGGGDASHLTHEQTITSPDAADAVTALYLAHSLGLTRMAHIMLGNRAAAEDVVHDAFLGLFRHWDHLESKDKALAYVRSSVLNGVRSAARSPRGRSQEPAAVHELSAEAIALLSEERRDVIRALALLPERQREVLVLRYYLDLPDDQISRDLGLTASTVRSTRRRALSALRRALKEQP